MGELAGFEIEGGDVELEGSVMDKLERANWLRPPRAIFLSSRQDLNGEGSFN